jgi:hypothetical protein
MKRICDTCKNFEVSMDNTKEICQAKKDGSQVIPKITDGYIEQRINGEKQNCKCYEKIYN